MEHSPKCRFAESPKRCNSVYEFFCMPVGEMCAFSHIPKSFDLMEVNLGNHVQKINKHFYFMTASKILMSYVRISLLFDHSVIAFTTASIEVITQFLSEGLIIFIISLCTCR